MTDMCFSPAEKTEIFKRLRHVEDTSQRHESTMKVGASVIIGFLTVLLGIAGWYWNGREESLDELVIAVQQMSVNVAEMRVSLEFFGGSFSSHVGDPNNHPNNTERVDRLREDLRDVIRQVEEIRQSRGL